MVGSDARYDDLDAEWSPVGTAVRGSGFDPVALVAAGAALCAAVLLVLAGWRIAQQGSAQRGQDAPPFSYVEARLLQWGEPPDEEGLPDRIVPPQPTAPKEVIPLDKDVARPQPPPKEPPKERQADAVEDDKLREVFERARAFAEIQDDYVPQGHPDGVRDGDVTDPALASLGATYGRRIVRLVRERWVVPTLIGEAERARLRVTVRIWVDADLAVTRFAVVRPSGNRLFDDSVRVAFERLQREVSALPEPPAPIAPAIFGGGIEVVLYGADAPMQ